MKIAFISCMVFCRDANYYIYDSQHAIHPFWMEQGLHDTPDILRKRLQEKIDEVDSLNERYEKGNGFEAIVLGYGLCSNGVVGLKAGKLPIIVPKCDDCMALFLGSQQRYLDYFHSLKGIYWFNKTWVEHAFVPTQARYEKMHEYYVKEYGEDNADYLMEIETGYTHNYKNALFIASQVCDDTKEQEEVKQAADYFGWEYKLVQGDNVMIRDLLACNWDNRFLRCNPGEIIVADYDGEKIKVERKDV